VMGSKNLKAVAVAGTQKVPVADEAGLNAYVTESMRAAKAENSPAYQLFTTFGTSGLAAASAMNGDSPVKNWAGSGEVDFPGASKVSDVALDKYRVRRTGCWHCAISCGAYLSVPDGPYATAGAYEHRPEYETLAAFGSMLLMDDTEAMLKVNELCNRAGMDTIAAGTTIAFSRHHDRLSNRVFRPRHHRHRGYRGSRAAVGQRARHRRGHPPDGRADRFRRRLG